jgi:SAM-dependent methyltransferase
MADQSDSRKGPLQAHWDEVYRRRAPDRVSWFQPTLAVSLDLVAHIGLTRSASILDVGGGASTFVDDLLARGHHDITVLDLSGAAMDVARARLGDRADSVRWIEGDITRLELPKESVDLWHDRAVFHFLTEPDARNRYVATAARALKPGGHIIVATFAPDGPEQCSGLEVARYDAESIHQAFGPTFSPISHREESHVTPWGAAQEFVYCYCRRTGQPK